MNNKLVGTICILAVCLLGSIASADPSAPQGASTPITRPVELKLATPIYPKSAVLPGAQEMGLQEALVTLSFTVKADGTTDNIKVVDGFYTKPFADAAIAAAKTWTFKPATQNGKPVDWNDYRMVVPFVFLDMEGGAYPRFLHAYEDVEKALKAKDFAGAKKQIQSMFDNHVISLLYGYAITEVALSNAELGLGREQAALAAVDRATPQIFIPREPQSAEVGSRINQREQIRSDALLGDKLQREALDDRFRLEASLGEYSDALDTLDRIDAIAAIDPNDPIAKEADLIKQAFASPEPLAIPAKIEDGAWDHRPKRHSFTIVDLKGKIDSIGVACALQVAQLPYQADVDWTVPASWGDCTIRVSGAEGTHFTFVEYADEGASDPAAH